MSTHHRRLCHAARPKQDITKIIFTIFQLPFLFILQSNPPNANLTWLYYFLFFFLDLLLPLPGALLGLFFPLLGLLERFGLLDLFGLFDRLGLLDLRQSRCCNCSPNIVIQLIYIKSVKFSQKQKIKTLSVSKDAHLQKQSSKYVTKSARYISTLPSPLIRYTLSLRELPIIAQPFNPLASKFSPQIQHSLFGVAIVFSLRWGAIMRKTRVYMHFNGNQNERQVLSKCLHYKYVIFLRE